MPFFVDEKNENVYVNNELTKTKNDIDNLSKEISNSVSEINNISYDPAALANLARSVNLLKNKLAELSDVSDVRGNIEQYISLLNTTNNEISDVVNNTKNLAEAMNNANINNNLEQNVLGFVNSFNELQNKVVNTQDYLSHLINNFKHFEDISNKINFDNLQQSNAFIQDSMGSFRELSNEIDKTKKSTMDFFSILDSFDNTSKVDNSFSSLYEMLDRFNETVNNINSSGGGIDEFNDYLSEVFYARQRVFDDLTNKVRDTSDPSKIIEVMSTAQPLIDNYSKILDKVSSMGHELSNKIQNNVIYNLNTTIDDIEQGVVDRLNSVRSLIDSVDQEYNRFLDSKSNFNGQIFENVINDVQDPMSEMYRMTSLNAGINTLNSISNNMGYSPINQLVRTTNNIRWDDNQNHYIDNDRVMEIGNSIQKDMFAFELTKDNIMGDIRRGLETGTDEDIERAKKGLQDLIQISANISAKEIDLGKLINIKDKETFNQLPSQVKQQINQIRSILNETSKNNSDLLALSDTLGLESEEVEGLTNVKDQLDNMHDSLGKVEGKSHTVIKNLKSDISGAFNDVTRGINKATRFLGIGALPIPFLGMTNFLSNSLGYASQQGQMSADAAQSYYAMGMDPDQANIYDMVHNKGLSYYEQTNGLIGFDEYQKHFSGLAKNVGGQSGLSNRQEAADINKLADNTFLLKKVYNMSDSTIQGALQTFYKDMKMSADDTSSLMMNLANTATQVNVPVEKYVSTVSNLASQFEKIGLDGKTAVSTMDDLVSKGMSLEKAQTYTTGMASAITSFGQNKPAMAYSGMMSGQFNDPWSAIRFGIDKYDENGKVREDYGKVMAETIDEWLSINGGLGGKNEDIQYTLVHDALKKMGFNAEQADIGASKWMENKSIFSEWVQSTSTENEQKDKTVVLEGKEELMGTMSSLGDRLSAVDKANAKLASSQYAIAGVLEKSIEPILDMATVAINDASGKVLELAKMFSELSNSKIVKDGLEAYSDLVEENPMLGLLAPVAVVGGTKLLTKGVTNKVKKSITNKGKKTKTQKTSNKLIGTADDVADTTRVLNTVDDAADVGRVLGATDDVAKGGSKLVSKLGKAGKIGLIATLAGGTAYGISKLFNNDKDEDEDIYEIGDYEPTDSKSSNSLFGRLDSIISLLSGGAEGTRTNTRSIDYNNYYFDDNGTQSENNSFINRSNVDMRTMADPMYPIDNSLYMEDMDIGAGLIGSVALIGGESAFTKITEKSASKVASQTGGKLSSAIGKGAQKTGLVSKAGKLTPKGIGVSALVGEAAENVVDIAYHGYKGDLLKEDIGKNTSDFLVDGGYMLGGAAIGTMIAPGIGTVIGSVGGVIAQTITDILTEDENGNGLSTRMKHGITKVMTGKNNEEIELKRSVSQGNYVDEMIREFKSLGFSKEMANYMVEGLINNRDKLKDTTSTQKLSLLQKYAEQRMNGSDEEKSSKAIASVLGNTMLLTQMEKASVDAILKTNDRRLKEEDVKTAISQAIRDSEDILTVGQTKEKSYDKNLRQQVDKNKQGTSLENMSIEEIISIYEDKDHKRNKEATEIIEKSNEKAKKISTNDAEDKFDKVYSERKRMEEELDKNLDRFLNQSLSTNEGKVAALEYESKYLQGLINKAKTPSEKNKLTKQKQEVDELKSFFENYPEDLKNEMKKVEDSLLKDKHNIALKNSNEHEFYQKVAREAHDNLSSGLVDSNKRMKKYEEQWADRINTEIMDGTTTTLDGLYSATDGLSVNSNAAKTLATTIEKLEQKQLAIMKNRDDSAFLNTSPQTNKGAKTELENYVNSSKETNLGKQLAGAAKTQVGLNKLFFSDEDLIERVGKSIGLFDSFKKSDILDSKQYSKADINKGLREGDIMYTTKKNGKVDQMGIYIGDGKVVTELTNSEAKKMGLKNGGVQIVDQSYFNKAVRNRNTYQKSNKAIKKEINQTDTINSKLKTVNLNSKSNIDLKEQQHKDVKDNAVKDQKLYKEINKTIKDSSESHGEKIVKTGEALTKTNNTLITTLTSGFQSISQALSSISVSVGSFGSDGGGGSMDQGISDISTSQKLPNPVEGGTFTNTWGAARSGGRKHEGVDIFAKEGTAIRSVTDGKVVKVGWNGLGGNSITIEDANGYRHYYTHMMKSVTDQFKVGDTVKKGQQIGQVGDTGNAKGTPHHLHYGIYKNGKAINPHQFLGQSSKTNPGNWTSSSSRSVDSNTSALSRSISSTPTTSSNNVSNARMASVDSNMTSLYAMNDYLKGGYDDSSNNYVNTNSRMMTMDQDSIGILGDSNNQYSMEQPNSLNEQSNNLSEQYTNTIEQYSDNVGQNNENQITEMSNSNMTDPFSGDSMQDTVEESGSTRRIHELLSNYANQNISIPGLTAEDLEIDTNNNGKTDNKTTNDTNGYLLSRVSNADDTLISQVNSTLQVNNTTNYTDNILDLAGSSGGTNDSSQVTVDAISTSMAPLTNTTTSSIYKPTTSYTQAESRQNVTSVINSSSIDFNKGYNDNYNLNIKLGEGSNTKVSLSLKDQTNDDKEFKDFVNKITAYINQLGFEINTK